MVEKERCKKRSFTNSERKVCFVGTNVDGKNHLLKLADCNEKQD